jgi:hypothetical protein
MSYRQIGFLECKKLTAYSQLLCRDTMKKMRQLSRLLINKPCFADRFVVPFQEIYELIDPNWTIMDQRIQSPFFIYLLLFICLSRFCLVHAPSSRHP